MKSPDSNPAAPPEWGRAGAPAPSSARKAWVLALVVAAAAILAYLPAFRAGFVNWDDPDYVVDNPHTRSLSAANVRWAFTTFTQANWHPVTWLSHMADGALFGADARGHHATSVLIHAANAGLLLLVLYGMTGCAGRSFLAAGLFALHPLNVESVAWLSERKNVLSTLFWILATGAYVRYARRPSAGRYALVALLFALGLLAKPMLVTFPATLLLLDAWPLRRFSRRAVVEKIPLFLISAVSCVVTVAAQRAGGALQTVEALPVILRLENAVWSAVRYLGSAVWPARLSAIVSFPGGVEAPRLPFAAVAACAAALAAMTAAAVLLRRRAPHAAFGWFWYLGTLVPVIGIVQVGDQGMADRYAYVPLLGVFVAFAWSIPLGNSPGARWAVRAGAVALLAALGAATHERARVWRNPETLWRATIAVNPRARYARNNFGLWLAEQGRRDEAIEQFGALVAIDPRPSWVHRTLGVALQESGRLDEAAAELETAIRLGPGDVEALSALAIARARQGRSGDARALMARALGSPDAPGEGGLAAGAERMAGASADPDSLYNMALALTWLEEWGGALALLDAANRLRPEHAPSLLNRGIVLVRLGRADEGVADYRRAVALDPRIADGWKSLAASLVASGRRVQAAEVYRTLLRLGPMGGRTALEYVWLLAAAPEPEVRNGGEAVEIAERLASATGGKDPRVLDALGAAYAEAGRFDEARRAGAAAAAGAHASGDAALAAAAGERAALYGRGEPYRSPR